MTAVLFRRLTRISAAVTSALNLGTQAAANQGASTMSSAKLNRVSEVNNTPIIRNPLPLPQVQAPNLVVLFHNPNPAPAVMTDRHPPTVVSDRSQTVSVTGRDVSVSISVL